MTNLVQPYLGLSPQRLTDLVNQDNNSNYQLGVDFTFSPPLAYSDAAGRNTKLWMYPKDPTKYSPTLVHYWRLPLTVLNNLPTGSLLPVTVPNVPFTTLQVLDAINAALGLNLTPDEVVNQTYTTVQDSYPLQINEAVSFAWINSDFQFKAAKVTPPASAYVGLRGAWYVQLNGNEGFYYPSTVGGTTVSRPPSNQPLALAPSPSQWMQMKGAFAAGGTAGAIFDIAVIDPTTGLPAATQPTSWALTAGSGMVEPSGTFQSYGYQSIYTDVEALLICSVPQSTDPIVYTVTGTYSDGSTITGTMTMAATLDLGPALNLSAIPSTGWGLLMNNLYVSSNGKAYSVNTKQLGALPVWNTPDVTRSQYSNQLGWAQKIGVPTAMVKSGADRIYLQNTPGNGVLPAWVKGTTGYGVIQGAVASYPVPAGALPIGNDIQAQMYLLPGGNIQVVGTPEDLSASQFGYPRDTILNLPVTSGVTTANSTEPTNSRPTLVQQGSQVVEYGVYPHQPNTALMPDTKGVVYEMFPNTLGLSARCSLDHTGILWSDDGGGAGTLFNSVKAKTRLSSVAATDGSGFYSTFAKINGSYSTDPTAAPIPGVLGITADNNVYNVSTGAKLTTSGNYRWCASGGVVDIYGQLNLFDNNGNLVPIPSHVKAPPGDTFAYQYINYPSGYAQYTGTVVPKLMRRIFSPSGNGLIAQGGYGVDSVGLGYAVGTGANIGVDEMVSDYYEFNPLYGLATNDRQLGWALNLDGSINLVESTSIGPQASNTVGLDPALNPEITNTKYMQIGKTTNGLPTNKSTNASIGLQFDGTVTPIGYASNSYTLASIYKAKKAKWITNIPGYVFSAPGALLTVDGDVLCWAGPYISYQGYTYSPVVSDAAYLVTMPSLVKLIMTGIALFGLDADGTIHEFDLPNWTNSLGGILTKGMPNNIVSLLPANTKAMSVIGVGTTLIVLSTDGVTGYITDFAAFVGTNNTPAWTKFTLSAPAVEIGPTSWTGGALSTMKLGAQRPMFVYTTLAGDLHAVNVTVDSTNSVITGINDLLLIPGFCAAPQLLA